MCVCVYISFVYTGQVSPLPTYMCYALFLRNDQHIFHVYPARQRVKAGYDENDSGCSLLFGYADIS